ncbi:hypothetical protein CPAR01_07875 [Colletotrichum paranaense]|nr:uncharacterized protein CPAR01_07875 [Colletotrichum paranaense]KAK1537762.1 hypothetical protein CPAR01_07875 [Colletotrichum paranaense]
MAEWAKQTYNTQYEKWVPWLEDVYLRWFTKDNKASYATKDTLDKSKVTGVEQVDTLQDGVHNLAAGQVGQGGLLQPVGDMVSKEGVNRAERQGKDDEGGYVPTAVPGSGALNQAGSGVAEGSKTVAGKTTEGVKGAGGFVGGLFGGGAGKTKPEQKSTEFTITDINLARNLFGVRWKTSISHPLRRINLSFRRQADQGSTFEQWVESWSAILRLLDTPQMMTVNLWLDSDIYYERYWLSVTGNVFRRVSEALAHKVAVSLPLDGHGDRIAGAAWLTGLDEVPWRPLKLVCAR